MTQPYVPLANTTMCFMLPGETKNMHDFSTIPSGPSANWYSSCSINVQVTVTETLRPACLRATAARTVPQVLHALHKNRHMNYPGN